MLLQEGEDEAFTSLTKIVAGKAREQVMLDLELETAIKPVHRGMTVDIERTADLVLDEVIGIFEGLSLVTVVRFHGEVREGDLDVNDTSDGVRDEEKAPTGGGVGEVREELGIPDKEDAGGDPCAGTVATVSGRGNGKVDEALNVEVEAGQGHHGQVEVLLDGEEGALPFAEVEDLLVIVGEEGTKELLINGEEGEILDVGVVFDRVGDDVVDVVRGLPPLPTDTVESVNKEGTDVVSSVRWGDAVVTKIVTDERKLLPEHAEGNGADHVHPEAVGAIHGAKHSGEEEGKNGTVPDIGHDRSFVQTCAVQSFVEGLKVLAHSSRLVVLDNADLGKCGEPLVVDFHGVVRAERISAVRATEGSHDLDTTRVSLSEGGAVIDLAIDCEPQIVCSLVLGNFFKSKFTDSGSRRRRSHFVFVFAVWFFFSNDFE